MAIPLKYSGRNLLVRKMTALATAGGIALVILVMVLLLSLVAGLKRTWMTTGKPENLLVLRPGSTSEMVSVVQRDQFQALRYLPGVARAPDDEPLVSPELLVQPFLELSGGGRAPILVRGVTPMGFRLHDQVRFIAGRPPRPSLGEVAIGVGAYLRYQGIVPGRAIKFGRRTWTVVGIFTAGDSAFESEVWVDVDDLFQDANRSWYSSVHLTVAPDADRNALIRRIAEDPRIALEAKSEMTYYSEQAEGANTLFLHTLLLAVIMGTGAVFGAMNAMFAAVAARTAEIGTLRALGFRRHAILASFVSESILLALVGYVGGVLLGAGAVTLVNVLTKGVPFQLPPFSTAIVGLRISPTILLTAFGFALGMGIVGGVLPARRAATLPVTEALRRV